jgi:UDPglucose 6-dehydrogenase
MFLTGLGREHGVETRLLGAVKTSNDAHRGWAARRLTQCLGALAGHTVAIWGLTYKPGTDTLRRSSAVELCRWLAAAGARVSAHDPAVTALPPDLSAIMHLASSPIEAVDGASALVVATPWPDYRQVPVEALARMTRPLVLDANRFLQHTIGVAPGVEYLAVGVGGAHT